MSISVNLRGVGDMKMDDYDPDKDGVISPPETEADMKKADYKFKLLKSTGSATFATKTSNIAYLTSTITALGTKITPSDEFIKSLTFNIRFFGASLSHTPFYYKIKKVSDDSVIVSKLAGYRNDEASGTVKDITAIFDTPVYVNEEVYLVIQSTGCNDADKIALLGLTVGGTGNAYKYEGSSWTQINAAYDTYFILSYYDQIQIIELKE
jgi:hypothetical protein